SLIALRLGTQVHRLAHTCLDSTHLDKPPYSFGPLSRPGWRHQVSLGSFTPPVCP
ncbi:hypothetical protein COCMIDRAFT_101227, partial [Bipolaris oryzae ATCC 44560]